MNADPAAQRRLLELAEVDAELGRIAHRRRTLPEHAEIATAEQDGQAGHDAVVTAETSASDLDRQARKLEAEIDQVRSRQDRDRKLLDSGSISDPRQLEELAHELDTLHKRQATLEDELLDVMERREATDAELARAQSARDEAQTRLADATGRRDEALSELAGTESRHNAERERLASELPDELLGLYERIRGHKGTGAALLTQRRCGACRLELDRTLLSRLRDAPPEEVHRCEECGAILVRTAESGL